jgi:hypothetical protein
LTRPIGYPGLRDHQPDIFQGDVAARNRHRLLSERDFQESRMRTEDQRKACGEKWCREARARIREIEAELGQEGAA